MVSTNSPFTREEWNDLIRRVNDVITDPPANTDCEPQPPLDEVGPDHIWAKSDIEEVRNALTATCDSISFTEPLILWKKPTYDELEDALGDAWCDCEASECHQCSNAGGTSITFLASVDTGSVCDPFENGDICSDSGVSFLSVAYGNYLDGVDTYDSAWCELCQLKDELEELEDELAGLTDPEEIIAKQAEVDAKQAEVDAKQAEVSSASSDLVTLAEATVAEVEAAALRAAPCTTLISPGQAWTDQECSEQWPTCCGCQPSRCVTLWALQRRLISTSGLGGVFIGSWTTVMRGGYTIDGSPYVSNMGNSFCCYIPFATCTSSAAGCAGTFSQCNGANHVYEFRMITSPPNQFDPYECSGGSGGSGGGGGDGDGGGGGVPIGGGDGGGS